MEPTPYGEVNDLLNQLLISIQFVLGNNLVGLYLYGSSTAEDFDLQLSDLDLLAAVKKDLNEREFIQLEKMHKNLADLYPKWKDRIEVEYYSLHGLQTFEKERSKIVVISPGEPLNIKDAGDDWLINWYVIQETGIPLFGPNQSNLIPNITKDEYIRWVKKQTLRWQDRIRTYNEHSTRGSAAYAILTMCRAMYSAKYGQQASKKQAALWVAETFPQWTELLDFATAWRKAQWKEKQEKVGSDLLKVTEFIDFAINQVREG